MFGLRWDQILAILSRHGEISAAVADLSVIPLPLWLKKYHTLIGDVGGILGTGTPTVPHAEAAKQVAAQVRQQVSPADLAIMDRLSGNNQGGG